MFKATRVRSRPIDDPGGYTHAPEKKWWQADGYAPCAVKTYSGSSGSSEALWRIKAGRSKVKMAGETAHGHYAALYPGVLQTATPGGTRYDLVAVKALRLGEANQTLTRAAGKEPGATTLQAGFDRECRAQKQVAERFGREAMAWVCKTPGAQAPAYLISALHAGDLRARNSDEVELIRAALRPIAIAMCPDLRWLKSEGLVHRDIKPENMLLGRPGEGPAVTLGDFSFATAEPEPGDASGTPGYAAIEAFAGGGLCHETDLYSFAIATIEMACGEATSRAVKALHDARSDGEIEAACLTYWKLMETVLPQTVETLGRGLDHSEHQKIYAWFARAVELDSTQRPDSVDALWRALSSAPISPEEGAALSEIRRQRFEPVQRELRSAISGTKLSSKLPNDFVDMPEAHFYMRPRGIRRSAHYRIHPKRASGSGGDAGPG